jgi:lipopolysaccharide heptosyltransferase II
MEQKPPTPKKILIRGTNWIGDTVMSLAAFRELRRLYPESHLAAYVKDWVAGVLREQGLVDEIISFGNKESGFGNRKKLKSFDTAVLFQNAFRAALLTKLARIPERIGYNTDGRSFLLTRKAEPRIKESGRHQVYYYLDLLYQAGLSDIDYLNTPEFKPDISLIPTVFGLRKAGELLRQEGVLDDTSQLIGINPGAYFGPAKRWLTDRYGRLADELSSRHNATILVFGSMNELPIAKEMASFMNSKPVILTGKTDLETYIALISLSRVFVTNDSGPMHLAAALNVPQVAIFGSTDDTATGPFSSRSTVIHKHAECSPCLLRECPIDLRCFTSIQVEEVLEAVEARMSETR